MHPSLLARIVAKSPLPRRVTLALLSAGLAMVLAGLLYASGRRRSFMPGPLMTAHRKLEFRCQECHTPLRNREVAFNDRCAAPTCHAKSVDVNAAKSDNCIQCHKPHQGRAFKATCSMGGCHGDLGAKTMKVANAAARDKFDHEKHNAKTRNQTDCRTCHPASQDGSTFTLPGHGECRACHEHTGNCPPIARARKQRSKKCTYCHLSEQYDGKPQEEPRPFAYVRFSHEPHAAFACADCHKDIDAARRNPKRYPLAMKECQACHAKPQIAESPPPQGCLDCHRVHHRYGRFAQAQTERGLVRAGKDWVTLDEAVKRFGDYAGRALSSIKREEPEEAKIHLDLAQQIAAAAAKSKWAQHPSVRKMKTRLKAIAKAFEEATAKAQTPEAGRAAAVADGRRRIKLRRAKGPRKKEFEFVSVANTYARTIEKAFERVELDCQLTAIDANARTKYAGVTLRKEVYWSLYGLRTTAEVDALSIIKAIFDHVPDVKEVMVEVESKLSEDPGEGRYERVLYVTATRAAYKKLNYAKLTLAQARKAFAFQYDKRVEKAKPE